jgi:hypothetical protein
MAEPSDWNVSVRMQQFTFLNAGTIKRQGCPMKHKRHILDSQEQ